MEKNVEDVFHKLYQLQENLEKQYENMEECGINEYLKDERYKKYWELIHSTFDKELLAKVDNKIGYGKFIDKLYLDTLYSLYEDKPRILDEYKGYTLKAGKDCYGNESAFININEVQQSDAIDLFNEQSLITRFREVIDENEINPYFYGLQ